MRCSKRIIAVSAWLVLLIALCIPAFSGALAEDEIWIDIPIGQTTEVFNDKGDSTGTLEPDAQGGAVFQAPKSDPITGVRVRYLLAKVDSAKQIKALIGKTKVQLSLMQAATPAPETTETKKPNPAAFPEYGWIDSNLVITALSARMAVDKSRANTYQAEIAALQAALANANAEKPTAAPMPTATPILVPQKVDQESVGAWVDYAALALGIVCAGALGWIALSVYAGRLEKEHQTEQLKKLNERLANGVSLNSTVKVEQVSWPRNARVEVGSDSIDRIAANLDRSSAFVSQIAPPESPKKAEPKPIPEGEEPDLLALANNLAGIASAAEWRNKIREAGWRYALLQANPTEKGTYVEDESGYSIIACLMRGAEAEIAYVVPSYQDSNAIEDRWHEFYSIEESNKVKNYEVYSLSVMFIERGVFFLPKSKGKLTRRPQKS